MPKAEQVELFSCDEYDTIIEALEERLENQTKAWKTTISIDRGSPFTARDFGIPQIEALIARVQSVNNDQAGR